VSEVRGTPVVIDGTGANVATTTAVRKYITDKDGRETFARRLLFHNQDATNSLLVQLSDGGAFLSIPFGQTREIFGVITSFVIKSSAATVAYTCVATVA
jgi:hypothetical protein